MGGGGNQCLLTEIFPAFCKGMQLWGKDLARAFTGSSVHQKAQTGQVWYEQSSGTLWKTGLGKALVGQAGTLRSGVLPGGEKGREGERAGRTEVLEIVGHLWKFSHRDMIG